MGWYQLLAASCWRQGLNTSLLLLLAMLVAVPRSCRHHLCWAKRPHNCRGAVYAVTVSLQMKGLQDSAHVQSGQQEIREAACKTTQLTPAPCDNQSTACCCQLKDELVAPWKMSRCLQFCCRVNILFTYHSQQHGMCTTMHSSWQKCTLAWNRRKLLAQVYNTNLLPDRHSPL